MSFLPTNNNYDNNNQFGGSNPLQNLFNLPVQLGSDFLYQKIGGDWLGLDKYKKRSEQDLTPFQQQLLDKIGQNRNTI